MTTDPKDTRFEMRMSEQERSMLKVLAERAGEADATIVRRLIREAYRKQERQR